jgi:hypothetical protein
VSAVGVRPIAIRVAFSCLHLTGSRPPSTDIGHGEFGNTVDRHGTDFLGQMLWNQVEGTEELLFSMWYPMRSNGSLRTGGKFQRRTIGYCSWWFSGQGKIGVHLEDSRRVYNGENSCRLRYYWETQSENCLSSRRKYFNLVRREGEIWDSRSTDQHFLDFGIVVGFATRPLFPEENATASHWMRGWVGHRAGLEGVVEWQFFTLPGLELWIFSRSVVHPLARQHKSYGFFQKRDSRARRLGGKIQ